MSKPTTDRQTTTPFLLHLIYSQNHHHPSSSYPLPPNHDLPRDRIQIYTWPTCSLRELSHLLTSALPNLLPNPVVGTRLSYRLVYPDAKDAYLSRGAQARYLIKEIGSVLIAAADGGQDGEQGATKYEGEPDKTLADARFVIGDFVSVAIFPPGENGLPSLGSAAMSDAPVRRGGLYSDRGRENGFRGGRGGAIIPPGEWRRGERIPDDGGYGRGGGGGGGYGRGRGRQW